MLRTYIQADERELEGLLPALELAYNTTSHSSTELSPFEIMIAENPLTAADLDIVGALAPTLTPLMTKLFRQLCDRARATSSRQSGVRNTTLTPAAGLWSIRWATKSGLVTNTYLLLTIVLSLNLNTVGPSQ
ncbi:hypothetical protein ETH_00023240 [Eimeria tenella]|uniref:Uncharacterized protein n=1 Tax=Eimeria tenella TaxID=5802 RepID=U6L4V7_EIMTE|nr:hypothetical protein ETH_00023240 [Eimeria tenella]CDJ45196.1 hypothetical protein ETH_00023240 [Eimeria tenella]|eukprot:XP_013235943.1 hypothetical protein ETH_00023240 [Eimeria tenella]